jgi:hypothetical protein
MQNFDEENLFWDLKFGRPRRSEDDIETNLKEMGCYDERLMYLAQDRV